MGKFILVPKIPQVLLTLCIPQNMTQIAPKFYIIVWISLKKKIHLLWDDVWEVPGQGSDQFSCLCCKWLAPSFMQAPINICRESMCKYMGYIRWVFLFTSMRNIFCEKNFCREVSFSTESSSAVWCNDRLVEVNFQHKLLLELIGLGCDVIPHLLFIACKKSYLKPTFLFCEALPHIHLMVCAIYVWISSKSEQVPSITSQKFWGRETGGCINISHINEEITTVYGNSRTDWIFCTEWLIQSEIFSPF